MKIDINSVHFKVDKKLEDFIKSKVIKIAGFYDGVIGSEVILRIDKREVVENKTTEIKLKVSGNDFFAKKQSATFEEATDNAVEALRKQLIKHKEKLRDRYKK